EARDLVFSGVARGQKDNRAMDALGPRAPRNLKAVEVRQHDVEDHQVRPRLDNTGERLSAIARLRYVKTLESHRGANKVGDVGLVVNNEHSWCGCLFVRLAGGPMVVHVD